MRLRWKNRIRAGKAFVSLLLGTNSLVGTPSPLPQRPSIPERVAAVRSSLAQKSAPDASSLAPPASAHNPQQELAQWINWPNWGNWNNWLNWNNWGNWANWANWRNF
jgi:hypothetical protein